MDESTAALRKLRDRGPDHGSLRWMAEYNEWAKAQGLRQLTPNWALNAAIDATHARIQQTLREGGFKTDEQKRIDRERLQALKDRKAAAKPDRPAKAPGDPMNPGPYPWRNWDMKRKGEPGKWSYSFDGGITWQPDVKSAFAFARGTGKLVNKQ